MDCYVLLCVYLGRIPGRRCGAVCVGGFVYGGSAGLLAAPGGSAAVGVVPLRAVLSPSGRLPDAGCRLVFDPVSSEAALSHSDGQRWVVGPPR